MKMDRVERGIVGVITNHSWLDNPTFRGMRQSLMNTFQQIHVLNLHGNSKKKERSPDGSKDENVFDIEQGVAITLFVREPTLDRGVWLGEQWGDRLRKYSSLAQQKASGAITERLRPRSPYYLFERANQDESEYRSLIAIPQIFRTGSSGIVTARDDLATDFSERELSEKIGRFVQQTNYKAKSTRGWSPDAAREALQEPPNWRKNISS